MRYALGVEYDGSDFRGWQNLGEGGPSVQASLEPALTLLLGGLLLWVMSAVLLPVYDLATRMKL